MERRHIIHKSRTNPAKSGVTIQAYYGGTLTGGAIIQLLKKHEVIMAQIREVCT